MTPSREVLPFPGFDPVLVLAQTLHATPSSHAVLLGAGVSVAAGVPSAWGVLEALIRQLAHADHVDPGDNPAAWYRTCFGAEPQYETLLEGLAPTPTERQRLLRSFFESPPDEEAVQPSLAHRSLARLVAAGTIKIILTLNFDRLMETALHDQGIESIVAATEADLAGLPPLHTVDALVVHLHGDYLSAQTMLNTRAELEAYPPSVDAFLDRVFDDYGLVAVGWSAIYDPALRTAVSRQMARHYTSYWVEPYQQSREAAELLTRKQMRRIHATADEALGRLADAVQALEDRQARHMLTLPAAVATAKRELAGAPTAIRLHDSIQSEFSRLRQLPDLTRVDFQRLPDGDSIEAVYNRIDEAVAVAAALAATTAYWGTRETWRWWLPEIERFAQPVRGGGLVNLMRSVNAPALHLLWVAGVAATAAGRLDLVRELVTRPHLTDANGGREPVAYALTPGTLYDAVRDPAPSFRLFNLHGPTFANHLALGSPGYEDAWETFEILRLLETTYQLDAAAHNIDMVLLAAADFLDADQTFQDAERQGDPDVHDEASSRLRAAKLAHDQALNAYASQVFVDRPHVRVAAEHGTRRRPPIVGLRLLAEVEREQGGHPLSQAGFCGGMVDHLLVTLQAVNWAVGDQGDRTAWATVQNTVGIVPDYFWLDSGERPPH